MIEVPSYRLQNTNTFNFRHVEWQENSIVENITKMLACAEQYGLIVRSIYIKNKEEKEVSEIKKTKSKILEINLQYTSTNSEGATEVEDINLSYELPWLMNNHFYISGNYKVCIYQLFDKPVIKRDDMIKIRTNINSFMIEKKHSSRAKFSYVANFFGKKFPFAKIIIAYYGVSQTKEKFNLNENFEYTGPQLSENKNDLMMDVKHILEDATIDKDRLFETEFPKKTNDKVIEDILLTTKIDIFSAKYLITPNIIEEFIYAIDANMYDDADYTNKRIRFAEQIIYCHLCRDFYNLINSIRKNRKLKFSINSKAILSNVNVSNIVQFDNSLNPLSELALLTRTSLSGPGGFEKSNVPQSLREIHPSMLYLVDPSDTADREGCGTIQYLKPNVEFNPDGSFFSRNNNVINSVSVSFVPFLEHDDATRLQMASSQQRHAIMLKKFDLPLIQTGVESMYTDQTSFIFKAKRDGKVIYLDTDIIAVQYDNKTCDAFNIGYRKLYISTVDFYKVYYNIGESFKKDDIIAESNYVKNGTICLGRNLLTCITPWYGYNYEDGIVISQKLVDQDYFTSIHYVDLVIELPINKVLLNLNDNYNEYTPLPKIGDRLSKGDVFAKIKAIDVEGYDDVIFEPIGEERSPEDCIITNIKIYANKWNKKLPQYDQFITEMVKKKRVRKDEISTKLAEFLTKEELDKVMDTLEINQTEKNNYKIKGDYIDGVRIELTAVYERKITVGDKLGNRHGNKGIISKILPENEMPYLPDGRRAEIIINPLGIVSRMNVGQVYEAHLSMALMNLKLRVKEMYNNKSTAKEIYDYILEFIKLIDKTDNNNYYQQMKQIFSDMPLKIFVDNIDNFYVIQPPFESIGKNELARALEYTHTDWEYKIFDPASQNYIENTINAGFMYFMKLNHIAQDKIAYRGIGPYSAKTSQPLGGKSRKGGQRLGEMEIWAVIAHGAEKNLNEFISTKSDSIKLRNEYISKKMSNTDLLIDSDDDEVPQSLRLLQINLKSIGLDYELFEGDSVSVPVEEVAEIESEGDDAIENLKHILGENEAEAELENEDDKLDLHEEIPILVPSDKPVVKEEIIEETDDDDIGPSLLDLSDFSIGQAKFTQPKISLQDNEENESPEGES